jgi:hypothetical protein
MNKKYIDLLYRSLDSQLGLLDQAELDRALKESAELRAEKRRIEELHTIFRRRGASQFEPFFAEKVMQRIMLSRRHTLSNADFFADLLYLFRRVAFAAVMVCLLIIAYNIIENDGLSMNNLLGFQDYTIEDIWLPVHPSYWESVQ